MYVYLLPSGYLATLRARAPPVPFFLGALVCKMGRYVPPPPIPSIAEKKYDARARYRTRAPNTVIISKHKGNEKSYFDLSGILTLGRRHCTIEAKSQKLLTKM
jgi:hypothetical protein